MNTPSATETDTQLSQTENKLGVQPPHNIEIEQSLLSSLMNVDESFDQVSEFIKASDFYGERHKIIFDTIAAVVKREGINSENSVTMEVFMGTAEGVKATWREPY